MSIPKTFFLLIFFSVQAFTLAAQNGCPGCETTLPAELAADTLFISEAPAGEVRTAYEADISFRVPKSTDPVAAIDPTVIAGIPIQKITLNTITNLPPGLSWDVSQREFNTEEETDGCIRLCGIPLEAGLFNIEVRITAQVFIVSQEASFTFPLLVEPFTSETEGFTMTNAEGCGQVAVTFQNKIPSEGRSGFSYSWDFGNGNTSIDEVPFAQEYSSPGKYPVNYQAIIDTAGYFLTNVRVLSTTCSDPFNNAPDLYVRIFDPEDNQLYQSDVMNNSNPPLNFNVNIPMGEGNYVVRVFDEDDDILGGDKNCGTYEVNWLTQGEQEADKGRASMTIFHPVDTVKSVDTVIVYEQPAAPQILSSNTDSLCQGDAVTLLANYNEGLQWFRGELPVDGAVDAAFTADTSGSYWIQYISADGCIALSETIELTFEALPPAPAFTVEKNLLTAETPETYSLQWLFDGQPLSGENNSTLCISESGIYSLEISDLNTGCSSSISQTVTYDPTDAGCVTTGTDLEVVAPDLVIFPNPSPGRLQVSFTLGESLPVDYAVYNTLGQQLQQQQFGKQTGLIQFQVDLEQFPSGIYWLMIRAGNEYGGYRIVKE